MNLRLVFFWELFSASEGAVRFKEDVPTERNMTGVKNATLRRGAGSITWFGRGVHAWKLKENSALAAPSANQSGKYLGDVVMDLDPANKVRIILPFAYIMVSSCVNSASDLLKFVVEPERDERPGLSKHYHSSANP